MAITRNSAIPKPHEQQEPTPLPPLHPVSETNVNSNNNNNNDQQIVSVSDYEQTREQRIKENRERLQRLGIIDLSLQLTSITASKRTPKRNHERKTPLKSPFLASNDTPRRSSRLQNAPPVTYTEPKEDKSRKTRDIVLEEGAKPEIYTEEHEKLLGNTEMEWTFGVDGCRQDGTRIYDPVNGKTCHQCRQKTLGLRTRCSKCNLVQGQFCGDCLIARYGEHVVEANQNPNWVCPPCRGICNCSLCRQAKGWYPTGAIYRSISKLGYKSVAHYLIATKRALPDSKTGSEAPQPAKRALPFEDDNELESKAIVESTETNQQSENNVIIADESTSTQKTRRRSEEKDNGSCEDNLEVKKASVGRTRKKPKNETNEVGDVIVSNVDTSNTKTDPKLSDSKEDSIARRLRSRNKT